jgi:Flp pilus assembly protein TadD
LHPALIESVSFTSSRFDLLQTTLLLLALLADVRLRAHAVARPVAIGIAFFAALLAKESAAVFPLVYFFWRLATTDKMPSLQNQVVQRIWQFFAANLWTWLALVIAGLGYLALRYAALGYLFVSKTASTIPAGDLIQRVLLVARSLAEYALVIVFPFTTLAPLHYTQLPIPHEDTVAWIALAIALALLGGLAWFMRRAMRPAALVAAGIGALGLALNIIPLELSGGTFIAERYLTFPLALFALALGSALSLRVFFAKQSPIRDLEIASSRKSLLAMTLCQVALVAWLIACAVTVELTISNWRDSLRLWTFAAARAPRSSLPHVNLSNYYLDQDADAMVLVEADAALRLDPNAAMAWNNRGVALFKTGQYTQAQVAWERAAQIEPGNALFWSNLANALRVQGRTQEAERMLLDQALRLDPNLGLAHFSLGVLYLDAGRPDLAIAPLENAARLLPPNRQNSAREWLAQAHDPEYWLRLGYQRLTQNDVQGAQQAYVQASAFGASPADVAVSQSAALIALKAWNDAETVLRPALQQSPNDARLFNNLGIVMQNKGDVNAAREYFSRAASLAPNWELPRQNLQNLGVPR